MSNKNEILEEATVAKTDDFTDMLEGMTIPELVKYARMTFGLQVTAKLKKHEIIAAIKDAQSKFHLNQDMQSEEAMEQDGLGLGMAEIQLHRTELTKGMKSIIVGLNGKHASLPIGVRFGCPVELVEILENAVRIEYEQDPETNELVERQTHSYPFTIFKVNPHTTASLAAARKKRGLRQRQY